MSDVQWTQVEPGGPWHIIDSTTLTDNGTWMVATLCGPPGGPQAWDQTYLDVLPGGSESSCENCLKIFARAEDQPEVTATSGGEEVAVTTAPKKRGRPRKNG